MDSWWLFGLLVLPGVLAQYRGYDTGLQRCSEVPIINNATGDNIFQGTEGKVTLVVLVRSS